MLQRKIDYKKYKIANAASKYIEKEQEKSQTNSQGRTNVGVTMKYNEYELNPEHIKIRQNKSEVILKKIFLQKFAVFKSRISESINKNDFYGEIEMTYEDNGKVKKYKFKKDIDSSKDVKKVFDDYIKAMNLTLPIDFEAFIVVKFTYKKTASAPEIEVEFF